MKKIGFIGYGNMGKVLLNSFLERKSINSANIYIFNRTMEKLNTLSLNYPDINILNSIEEVSNNVELIFICTSTYSVKEVIEKININPKLHIVLINAGIEISSIETIHKGKITRIIPTMTSEVFVGYNIICHNKIVNKDDRQYMEELFNSIGEVVELSENQFAAGSDLTSCAPAIISEMHNLYIKAISQKSNIPENVAEKMFKATLIGTQHLLEKTGETAQELINRVATKGGSTDAAVNILREQLPNTFIKMLNATLESHTIREKHTRNQFNTN